MFELLSNGRMIWDYGQNVKGWQQFMDDLPRCEKFLDMAWSLRPLPVDVSMIPGRHAVDIVNSLLSLDSDRRPLAHQVLQHQWLNMDLSSAGMESFALRYPAQAPFQGAKDAVTRSTSQGSSNPGSFAPALVTRSISQASTNPGSFAPAPALASPGAPAQGARPHALAIPAQGTPAQAAPVQGASAAVQNARAQGASAAVQSARAQGAPAQSARAQGASAAVQSSAQVSAQGAAAQGAPAQVAPAPGASAGVQSSAVAPNKGALTQAPSVVAPPAGRNLLRCQSDVISDRVFPRWQSFGSLGLCGSQDVSSSGSFRARLWNGMQAVAGRQSGLAHGSGMEAAPARQASPLDGSGSSQSGPSRGSGMETAPARQAFPPHWNGMAAAPAMQSGPAHGSGMGAAPARQSIPTPRSARATVPARLQGVPSSQSFPALQSHGSQVPFASPPVMPHKVLPGQSLAPVPEEAPSSLAGRQSPPHIQFREPRPIVAAGSAPVGEVGTRPASLQMNSPNVEYRQPSQPPVSLQGLPVASPGVQSRTVPVSSMQARPGPTDRKSVV